MAIRSAAASSAMRAEYPAAANRNGGTTLEGWKLLNSLLEPELCLPIIPSLPSTESFSFDPLLRNSAELIESTNQRETLKNKVCCALPLWVSCKTHLSSTFLYCERSNVKQISYLQLLEKSIQILPQREHAKPNVRSEAEKFEHHLSTLWKYSWQNAVDKIKIYIPRKKFVCT